MSPTTIYTISANAQGEQFATVFPQDGAPVIAGDDHPNWSEIIDALTDNPLPEDELVELFDASEAVAKRFQKVTERVSVANGRVYFDGDEVDSSITGQILRFLDEGFDVLPLARFMENVAANPEQHSREQLYEWLRRHDFTITPEGNFVGYKGVQEDFSSIHRGKAVVDGEAVDGAVPNRPGSTVEFPRSEVHADPAVGCSRGLHVGTYDYATAYSARGHMLEVHVNPRDVVSVPTDCNAQKVRVCRYQVVQTIDAPYEAAFLGDPDAEPWDEDEALDEQETCWCGDPDCDAAEWD